MRRILFLIVAIISIATSLPAFAQTAAPAPAQPVSADEAQFLKNAEPFVRKLFGWGPDFKVKLGPASRSSSPDFYVVPVQITVNEQTDTGSVYISKDGKSLLRGELFDTTKDPYAENRAKLRLEGNPSKGPWDARVTVVEFSDFQCPHCRALYQVMKELEPRYPQIRIVYMDLPIAAIHPWAGTAAVGGRCAYMQSPDSFWKIHDALFENQEIISAANVWQKLVDFAGEAGLDKDAFKACLTSPEPQKAVEQSIGDAVVMGVTSTPTVFVNGRPVVGGDAGTLQQFIEYELGGAQNTQPKPAASLPGPPEKKQPNKIQPK